MKNNYRSMLLLLGMAAFTQSSFAQTEAKTDEVKKEDVKVLADLKPAPKLTDSIKAPDLSKLVQVKKIELEKPKDVVSFVEPEELSQLGVGLAFDGNNLQMTGKGIPSLCEERLSLDVKNDSSDEDKSDLKIEKKEDLKSASTHINARVSFRGTGDMKTLSDCKKIADGEELADLSKNSKLRRSVLSDSEVAIAGFLDSSNKLVLAKDFPKSTQYRRLEKQFEALDCKSCNANGDSLRARMKDLKSLDSPLVASLFPKLLEESISQLSKKIAAAKRVSALKDAREELASLAKEIPDLKISADDKQEQLEAITTALSAIVDRNKEITKASAKTDKQRSESAEFIGDTYAVIANLPGLDEESRDQANEIAKSYRKDGDARVDYLMDLNPNHAEVTDALNKGQMAQANLQRKAQAACQGVNNQRNFVRCSEAYKAYADQSAKMQKMTQNFWSVQNSNNSQLLSPLLPQNASAPQNSWFNAPAQYTGAVAVDGKTPSGLVINRGISPEQEAIIKQQNALVTPNSGAHYQAMTNSKYDLSYTNSFNNPEFMKAGITATSSIPAAIPLTGFNTNAPQVQPIATTQFQPNFIMN